MTSQKIILITVVHGPYHLHLNGWVNNLCDIGFNQPIHLIVLDSQDVSINDSNLTTEYIQVDNPTWGSGDYIRLKKIRQLCSEGWTCIQADIDIYFNQNPALYSDLHYELVISRGLGFPPKSIKA